MNQNTKHIAMHHPTQWYVSLCGETVGPISIGTITRMLKEHRLDFLDFVWTAHLPKWTRIVELEEFADLAPSAPSTPLPEAPSELAVAPKKTKAAVLDAEISIQKLGSYPIFEITTKAIRFQCESSLVVDQEVRFSITAKSIVKPLEMTGLLLEDELGFLVEFTRVNPAHLRSLGPYLTRKGGR